MGFYIICSVCVFLYFILFFLFSDDHTMIIYTVHAHTSLDFYLQYLQKYFINSKLYLKKKKNNTHLSLCTYYYVTFVALLLAAKSLDLFNGNSNICLFVT